MRTRALKGDGVPADEVVLLGDDGRPIGRADRSAVHTDATPLHGAFSTYLFNGDGQVLLTRRSLGKRTWPGVWTNSCCGHPRPGESVEDAARRRIREELGLTVGHLTLLLPDFRYRATDATGIVENEICPVYAGFVTDQEPAPDPAEVSEWTWVRWNDLAAAIAATPAVYSPWAALQVPLMVPPTLDATGADSTVPSLIDDVDALLHAEIASLEREWSGYAGRLGVDILPEDLPGWMGRLLVGQGKRLRVRMAHAGFVAVGGSPNSPGYRHLVRASAALETLHLFALVQDDVMDQSETRRGRPSAHVEATAWHREANGFGDTRLFGHNVAILLGDLAHTVADRLVQELPDAMRTLWYLLSVELIAGQRADLTGAAAGRRDRVHAELVARVKSGRYTITRPLQLGALAAGAPPDVVATLLEFGDLVGEAFALRDDVLGVWGEPAVTGKPAGDDLFQAKATVLLALARDRLQGGGADLLARVGTPGFSHADIPVLADLLRTAGVADEVEGLIAESIGAALAVLDRSSLEARGLAELRDAARAAVWRDA